MTHYHDIALPTHLTSIRLGKDKKKAGKFSGSYFSLAIKAVINLTFSFSRVVVWFEYHGKLFSKVFLVQYCKLLTTLLSHLSFRSGSCLISFKLDICSCCKIQQNHKESRIEMKFQTINTFVDNTLVLGTDFTILKWERIHPKANSCSRSYAN